MPTLSKFQAIFFDVDNTLSNSKKEITAETLSALSALQHLPLHLQTAVCTGRVFAGLDQYVLQYFPSESIHIIAGGAQVIRTNGEVLWEKLIPDEVSRPLCQKLLAENVQFLISQNQKMYITPLWKSYLVKGVVPISFGELTELHNWVTPLISINDVSSSVRQIVHQFPELTVKEMTNASGRTYFDLTASGVNKATALAKWSKITSIQLPKIIGFGDSSNDFEFLQKVGYAVAMGNATPEIKTIANRVIGDSDADGLAVYLRQISEGAEL